VHVLENIKSFEVKFEPTNLNENNSIGNIFLLNKTNESQKKVNTSVNKNDEEQIELFSVKKNEQHSKTLSLRKVANLNADDLCPETTEIYELNKADTSSRPKISLNNLPALANTSADMQKEFKKTSSTLSSTSVQSVSLENQMPPTTILQTSNPSKFSQIKTPQSLSSPLTPAPTVSLENNAPPTRILRSARNWNNVNLDTKK
jgi:hypothetical protein